jgi:hypothetical protein
MYFYFPYDTTYAILFREMVFRIREITPESLRVILGAPVKGLLLQELECLYLPVTDL